MAESRALAAALICRFGCAPVLAGLDRLILAHLFLAAAAILARPAALIVRLWGADVWLTGCKEPPRRRANSLWSESTLSLTSAALLSCCGERLLNDAFIRRYSLRAR